jgi:hypothetical protein
MKLEEYSTAVKEIINGKPTKATLEFVKQLPLGKSNNAFSFQLSGKVIKMNSSLKSFSAIYQSVSRMNPQQDYTLSLRLSVGGKSKTVSKRFSSNVKVEDAEKELYDHFNAERIFYEIITTDDFEITNSDYEGTILKAENEETARRYFYTFMGIFPYVELERDSKLVKIDCEFDIKKDDLYGKDEKKRGKLNCNISIDGESAGTKSNSFVF